MPERIQMRRTKGWRKPDGAVYVGRPTKWGNPISLSDVACQYPSLADRRVATIVVRDFAVLARQGALAFPNWRHLDGHRGPVRWTYPSVDEIRRELAGKDLACWCPFTQPCHADVLLEMANGADMPIRPENRGRYPDDWVDISDRIRFERAGGRCECTGQCGRPGWHLAPDGRCENRHGQPAIVTGSKVVLTTAHLDHTPEHCDDDNLLAMCQGCHLHYDRDHHADTARRTRAAELAESMDPLFALPEGTATA